MHSIKHFWVFTYKLLRDASVFLRDSQLFKKLLDYFYTKQKHFCAWRKFSMDFVIG